MKELEFTGFVTSRKNLNEADKVITVFSEEKGKIAFIAKGIRKPKAKLQSQLEPLVEIKFRVVGNSKLPTLVGAKGIKQNSFFSSSLEANLSALLLTEIVDIFSMENMKNELAYKTYYEFIEQIIKNPKTDLVLNYYLLQILKDYGLEPNIEPGLPRYFLDFTDGTVNGLIGNNSVAIDLEVVKLWNACLRHNSMLLDKLKVKKSILADSLNLIISYIQYHGERKIKSAKVLSESTNLLQAS